MLGIAPLEECLIGLVVLDVLGEEAVDDPLLVVELAAGDAIRVRERVLVDVHFGDAGTRAARIPLLGRVVVDHDARLGAHDHLLVAAAGLHRCLTLSLSLSRSLALICALESDCDDTNNKNTASPS